MAQVEATGTPNVNPARLSVQETPLTPTGDFFIVDHFGAPDPLSRDALVLSVRGETVQTLSFEQLRMLPERTVRTVLECSGNGEEEEFPVPAELEESAGHTPAGDDEPPPRLLGQDEYLVGMAEFTGVPVAVVLEQAGLRRDAASVVVRGRDRGVPDAFFHGLPEHLTNVDPFNYEKALPIDKALDPDTLLAWGMNGEPLAHLHGGPLRLVVPGWSSNWSVKWASEIAVLDHMPECWYQTEYYYFADSLTDATRTMITALPVKSIVTEPSRSSKWLPPGPRRIRGYAWSGRAPIRRVEVTLDGGKIWIDADLDRPECRWAWTPWSVAVDLRQGDNTVMSRATDEAGRTQPRSPMWNVLRKNFNGMIPVTFTVGEPV